MVVWIYEGFSLIALVIVSLPTKRIRWTSVQVPARSSRRL